MNKKGRMKAACFSRDSFLVHKFLAFSRSTVTFQFLFFFGELVVVCELLTREDLSQCKYDDMFAAHDVRNLAVAVWLQLEDIILRVFHDR